MLAWDELERYLQQRAEEDTFSGVALITRGSAQMFAGAYGYASRAWKVPNTLTTRFDTASVTKLFTAVATLQLIDRGVLAFDTPVIEYLGLRDTTISPAVNVFHLLTHTSGIGHLGGLPSTEPLPPDGACGSLSDLPTGAAQVCSWHWLGLQ